MSLKRSSSSASKIQNKLQNEITHKIQLLIDKPISPKTTQQIIQLIDHPSSSKYKIFNIFLNKYRGDIILLMIQKYPQIVSNQIMLNQIISNLQRNMMKYNNNNKSNILISIWKQLIKLMHRIGTTIMNKSLYQTQQLIYQLAYQNLLQQGIKAVNIQKKQKIFQIIYQNIKLFWQLGLKDNLRKVIVSYIQVFRKLVITNVVNYIKVITLIVQLIKLSQQRQTSHQQKQQHIIQYNKQYNNNIKLQKLPEIQQQHLSSCILQLNNMLELTKQKQLHQWHNQCIIAIVTIIDSNYHLDKCCQILSNNHTIIYQLQKTLQTFLYRKGTRDCARKLSTILIKVNQTMLKQNQLKMVKQYSPLQQRSHSLINLSQRIRQKPILIQNVIHRTNQFLAKYHVNNVCNKNKNNNNKLDQIILFQSSNNKYLKKGEGMGGGRAVLGIDDIVVSKQRQMIINLQDNCNGNSNSNKKGQIVVVKKRDKFELMLQNCLQNAAWEKNDKNAFVKIHSLQNKHANITQQPKQRQRTTQHQKLQHYKQQFKQNITQQFNQSIYSEFYQYQQPSLNNNNHNNNNHNNNNHNNNHNNNNHNNNNISQDDVQQINQLIDLAYSYKFNGVL